MHMKGQLSAEMLILIAVILAVVAIVAIQILGAAKQTGEKIGNQTDRLDRMTDEAIKAPEGGFCLEEDEDPCQQGLRCVDNRCVR